MKVLTWCKVVVSGCLSFGILLLALQAKHNECISSELQKFKLKKLGSENDIVKDATQRIKDSFKKTGHPSSIRCTYTLSGANAISATTKVYYDEYRKRPDYFTECYLHEAIKADKVVEVFYKKHGKSLSLSVKNPKHRHEQISCKKVKIASALAA
jgi:hypothetical protein